MMMIPDVTDSNDLCCIQMWKKR